VMKTPRAHERASKGWVLPPGGQRLDVVRATHAAPHLAHTPCQAARARGARVSISSVSRMGGLFRGHTGAQVLFKYQRNASNPQGNGAHTRDSKQNKPARTRCASWLRE